MENSMIFNILIKEEEDMWVAHCLELDIVATADSLEAVEKDIKDLVITQVDYAFSNDNLENLYHPAPPETWKEFYECNELTVNKIMVESAFRTPKTQQIFVPPWIIANTCFIQGRAVV